jgi:hypothetical protein
MSTNFSAGEISPLLEGRVEISKYYNAAKTIENFIVTPYGGIEETPGTYFAAETKDSSKKSIAVPFKFSTIQAYMLEFGDQYIRFFKDQGTITEGDKAITGATQADPVVVTAVAHGYSNGDEIIISGVVGMTELNGKRFIVSNKAANTFELKDKDGVDIDGTGYTAYVSGGVCNKVVEISTPYLESELFDLQFAQSADTLYIVHNNHAVRKLTRTSHTAWTLTVVDFQNGPYLPSNISATTITPSADAGAAITLTASTPIFLAGHVGSSWRVKNGWVKIVGFTSTTVVTADVQEGGNLGTGPGATTDWAEGAWSGVRGYPACDTFHEQRLCFASSIDNPQTFWASKSQEFERMDAGASDDDALIYTIASEQVDAIRWLSSGDVLAMGTVGGVFTIRSTSDAPLTPTNVKVQRDTTYGSAFTLPKKVGSFVYYIQRNLRTLRELTFNFDLYGDNRLATDMTLLAEHITGKDGIVQMAYQQSPHNVLWCVRADGQIATLTRQIEQEVVGWSRQVTDGLFESVAVIPSTTYDEVWTIVKRTINGVTRRYVEYFAPPTFEDQEDVFYVHSGLSLDVPIAITGATQANPVVITAVAHGLSNGDKVVIRNMGSLESATREIVGMVELDKRKFKIKNKTANTFELTDSNDVNIDGTGYSAYVLGGEARKAVTTISGLDHLEGKTVDILIDGATHPQKVVSSGSITLDEAYGEVHVGLPYLPKLLTLRPEVQTSEGTAQGKTKRVVNVVARVYETLGFQVGTEEKQYDGLFDRDFMDQAPDLFTGDKEIEFPSGYDKDGNILITQPYPLPLNILAIILQLIVEND